MAGHCGFSVLSLGRVAHRLVNMFRDRLAAEVARREVKDPFSDEL